MTPPRLRPRLAQLSGYQAGAAPSPVGGRAFKLSSNENPFAPLPGVLDAVAQAAAAMNRYPDPASSALTSALALHLGVGIDRLALGTGSVGVLQQVLQAVAEPGDEVLYAWRSFEAYPIVTAVVGAEAVQVPLRPDGTHDLAAMVAGVTDRTRAMLLCTPNNPTGTVLEDVAVRDLLGAVPADVLVVIDEAYAEFVRRPDAVDGLALAREYDNIVVLRTFSKAYGLAGLRVGYAVAHPTVAAALRMTAVPFGVSSLGQAAAVASLSQAAALLERVQALVVERERVATVLRGQGWAPSDSEANFLWLRLDEQTAAFAAACQESGISVRAFAGEGVRVSIGEPAANDAFLEVAAGQVR